MKGVYAGSFDPPTKGHLDIITRASALLDELVVLIGVNSAKTGSYPPTRRQLWLEEACAHLPNVKIMAAEGLTVENARALHADVLIRSLRNDADFDPEASIAWLNAGLKEGMETLFLIGKPEYAWISSTSVRELLKYGQSIEKLVPENVFKSLQPELYLQSKSPAAKSAPFISNENSDKTKEENE